LGKEGMILDNLDAECKRAVERLNRSIGQRVRYAKAAQKEQYEFALGFIDLLYRAYCEGAVPL
jgi:hypothetical protein